MYCKNCGEIMNDNQAICLKCGVKTGDGNKFCANCGRETTEGAEFCLNCGVALKNPQRSGSAPADPNYLNGQDKLTMALICFFLGALGIHNFMLGETKKGIFKIVMSLCCGIGAILALIDFVRILTDSYVVDPDKLV